MIDEHYEKHFAALSDTIESRFFGKYRGMVIETEKEREKIGMITVQIPEIYFECTIPFIKPCVPLAGKDCGFFAFPKIGDGIWIEFEGGDQSRPIWTGFWWKENEIPEFINLDTVGLVSRTGHRIILDDKNDSMSLLHVKGPEIKLTAEEITFKVGRTEMVISNTGITINKNTFKVTT